MISFACVQCSTKIRVQPKYAGRTAKCPTCKQPLVVPEPVREVEAIGSGQIDGTPSSLAQAGLDGAGVVLERNAGARAGQKTVEELLARRNSKTQRYIVEGEIARGGMGAVLRAVDCDIRREVAVKYLLDQGDPRKKLRFVEEVQITGQLEHPNIVPIHELGLDAKKRLFFAMKMVQGRSLAGVLDELRGADGAAEREFSLGRLLSIFVSICHALGYAHNRGVIHRDLKPANIMIGNFGEVYVMDWGLAKVLAGGGPPGKQGANAPRSPENAPGNEPLTRGKVVTSREPDADLTQDGAILGTPIYMSPEQAGGEVQAVDQRSDVYALGAILYEILALLPPIDNEGGYLAVLWKVIAGNIVPPEQRNPARAGRIPRELSAIAMKALAKEPGNRYASVDDLRRDIERFLEGRSVSAKDDTKWEMLVKFAKRNKAFSAVSAVASVLLTLLTALSFTLILGQMMRAEKALADFTAEQTRREAQGRNSVPAFLRAARLSANDREFDDALAQTEVALGFDPANADALLLRCKILILKGDFSAAEAELQRFRNRWPDNTQASRLLEMCRQYHPADPTTLAPFVSYFYNHKDFNPTATRDFRDKLSAYYTERVESSWPGLGNRAKLDTQGRLELTFDRGQVTDLKSLRGLPVSRLHLGQCNQIKDLRPLKGMPLIFLSLYECKEVRDLNPLHGMPLAHLDLTGCTQITTFKPLAGLPLVYLNVKGCNQVKDLAFVRGLALTSLVLTNCPVSDLTPLQGMPLGRLVLHQTQVRDLTPLRGLPLATLDIVELPVDDLRPLENVPLERLMFTPRHVKRGLDVIRRMKTLKIIGTHGAERQYTPEEFWKRFDAGEFKK